MLRLRSYALAVALAAPSLVACGGDDGGNSTPDARPQVDSGPTCDVPALGAGPTIAGTPSTDAIVWSQDVTTDLGTGGAAFLNFEFYSGIEASLSGAIDLSAGNQNNYKTCAACVRLVALNAAGDAVAKTFFQSGGTLTMTEDPFTHQKLVATATDVTLVEVTVADDYTSTLVPGGKCLSLGTLNLNADAVPAEWTCAKDKYNDGATCDCACGAHDPDCDINAAPVAGCTGNQICGSDDTCIDTCDVLSTPPVTCPAGVCGYQSATQDICYTDATVVDPAALGSACASATPLFCAVNNTVATGLCDTFEGDDLQCRKACDAAADCSPGQVCAAIVGAKGLCVTPPTNDTCATATPVVLGTPVNGSTGGATANYNMGLEVATCDGAKQPGGDVVYSVVLTAGQKINAALTNVSGRFDPSVAIVGPGAPTVCDVSPIVCGAGADAKFEGEDESFMYTAATAGTYYIIVDSFYATQGGSFTLTVTNVP